LQLVPIREDVHRAVAIGSQNPDSGRLEPLEQLRIGMAVRIVFSCADHRDPRMNSGQKSGHRRVFTSVMADFEDVCT
jgi:hypothetical protein